MCLDDETKMKDMLTLDCEHRFCQECVSDYASDKINNNKVKSDELVCPKIECNIEINPLIIKTSVTEEIYNKYIDFKMKQLEDTNANEIFYQCQG
jgi:ariadne-1